MVIIIAYNIRIRYMILFWVTLRIFRKPEKKQDCIGDGQHNMADRRKKESKRQKAWQNSFFSILDLEGKAEEDEIRPAFYMDLNLDRVIDRIRQDWGQDVSPFYYCLPADAAGEDYRREVYADIKQPGCYESLCTFLEGMKAREEALVKKEAVRVELQKAFWHIREAACYCEALRQLLEALDKMPLHSAGMLTLIAFLREYLDSEEFVGMQEAVRHLLAEAGAFRLVLTYENDRITVAQGEVDGAYEQFLARCCTCQGQEQRMEDSPFGVSANLSELEGEILKIFQKQNPGFFKNVEGFYKKYEMYAQENLLRFSAEISFYLSFYCFEQRMREEGFAFAEPQQVWGQALEYLSMSAKDESNDVMMYAEGVYDLALSCAVGREREIVSNDVICRKGEQFFVLTGPNQGGKTTFARSLGQMVYFAKMGLDVPAKAAFLPRFTDILTHFSVEESVETGRGKLKEELARLAPMMKSVSMANPGYSRSLTAQVGEKVQTSQMVQSGQEQKPCAFVIINELFTTAANYDACIMGKRVLEFFLGQGCMGIYVTHLKELAEASPGIVSLRAMVDEAGRQTFRIARGEAADSASAVNQVRKYRLTYEALKDRLSEGMPVRKEKLK